jgi:hypothetical protein
MAGSPAAVHPFTRKHPLIQLLPVPTPEDISGFIALIKKLYGKEMSRQDAGEALGRLMRFYYLTRLKPHLDDPGEAGAKGVPEEEAAEPS